jgi:small subunit ribosomal protein S5
MKNGAVQTIAQRSKEEQEKVEADMFQQREEWDRKRKMKVKRERGWSGNTWGGISLGAPDPGPNGGSSLDFVCLFEISFVCLDGLFQKKDLHMFE